MGRAMGQGEGSSGTASIPVCFPNQMTQRRFQELSFGLGLNVGKLDVQIRDASHTFLLAFRPRNSDLIYGAMDMNSPFTEYGHSYFMSNVPFSLGSEEGQARMFSALGY